MPAPIESIGSIQTPSAFEARRLTGFDRPQATDGMGLTPLSTPQRSEGTSFGSIFTMAVENLQNRQQTAQRLGIQAATGRLDNVHDYTIAASESKLTMELTSAIRNKAVDAFNEIMRMQA